MTKAHIISVFTYLHQANNPVASIIQITVFKSDFHQLTLAESSC